MKAWLQLIRVPNLLTVPGDPIAGFLVISLLTGAKADTLLIVAVISSLLLYIGGLITNDVCDMEIDREQRPTRPLPSGRISPAAASSTATVLFITALLISFFYGSHDLFVLSAVLCLLTLTYNRLTKSIPVLGVTNMALCRAFNVLLGTAAGGFGINDAQTFVSDPIVMSAVLFAPSVIFVYTLALSIVAKNETHGKIDILAFAPAFVIALVGLSRVCELYRNLTTITAFLSALCLTAGLTVTIRSGWKIYHAEYPAMTPKHVGHLISGMIPLQTFLMLTAGEAGILPAALTIAAYPIFFALARKFYAS